MQVSLTTHKSPLPAITREILLSQRCSIQQSDLLLQYSLELHITIYQVNFTFPIVFHIKYSLFPLMGFKNL